MSNFFGRSIFFVTILTSLIGGACYHGESCKDQYDACVQKAIQVAGWWPFGFLNLDYYMDQCLKGYNECQGYASDSAGFTEGDTDLTMSSQSEGSDATSEVSVDSPTTTLALPTTSTSSSTSTTTGEGETGNSSSTSDSSSTGKECQYGTEGCDCYEGECFAPLSCVEGTCEYVEGCEGCPCNEGQCFGDMICRGDICIPKEGVQPRPQK